MTETHQWLARPNTPEWEQLRNTGIGASEAAAAAGVSDWSDPLVVYHRKRGELPPVEQNDAMRRGHALEPLIVQEFARTTGLEIAEYPCGLARHPDYRWVLATPDAVVSDKAGLECKSTNWRMAHRLGGQGTDELPFDWLCQAQQQAAVMGWEVVHFAVWVDTQSFLTYVVHRDDVVIGHLIAAEEELWARIEAGEPPEVQWTARHRDVVKRLYREVEPQRIVQLPEDLAIKWLRSRAKKDEAKRLEQDAKALEAEVLAEVGNAEVAVIDDGRMIRRKEIAREPYTVTPKPYIDVREVALTRGVREVLDQKSTGENQHVLADNGSSES